MSRRDGTPVISTEELEKAADKIIEKGEMGVVYGYRRFFNEFLHGTSGHWKRKGVHAEHVVYRNAVYQRLTQLFEDRGTDVRLSNVPRVGWRLEDSDTGSVLTMIVKEYLKHVRRMATAGKRTAALAGADGLDNALRKALEKSGERLSDMALDTLAGQVVRDRSLPSDIKLALVKSLAAYVPSK
jgi:hypothetical protein